MRGSGLGNNPRLPIGGIYLLYSVFKEKNTVLISTWLKSSKKTELNSKNTAMLVAELFQAAGRLQWVAQH